MTTTIPIELSKMLTAIGQAAVEVDSFVEDYREFVTVFRCPTDQMIGFHERFPYLVGNAIVYRLMRFRVESSIIENDQHCSNDELIGLQSLYVATEEDLIHVLRIWQVSPDSLRPPSETEVPV